MWIRRKLFETVCYCWVLLLFVSTNHVFAQNRIMPSDTAKYEKWSLVAINRCMSSMFNINYSMPNGFVDLNHIEFLKKIDKSPDIIGCPILQSKDKECILIYSLIPQGTWNSHLSKEDSITIAECPMCCPPINPSPYSYAGRNMQHRHQMFLALKDILKTDTFEMDSYISILSPEKSRKWFNADSVFFLKTDSTHFVESLLTGNIYRNRYVYCTNMFISKYNHGMVYLKWLFTEKGKKKEQRYLKKLAKNIWFDDSELHLSQQEDNISFEWLGRIFSKGY